MKYLVKNKHWDLIKDYNLDKLLYLLIDRPDHIEDDFYWFNKKDQFHKNYDLPAIVRVDGDSFGDVEWYRNDKFHRTKSKPAIINNDGYKEYWIKGTYIKDE